MVLSLVRVCALALAGIASVAAQRAGSQCLAVSNDGEAVGHFKNVSGIQIYHSYPVSRKVTKATSAVLVATDIYGVPLLQNKLLADSFARANYLVVMPDLFRGDAVPVSSAEGGLNLTEWRTRHPPEDIDSILSATLDYLHNDLGVTRVGAVGYCFGGKYVSRFLAEGKGVDVGFIAHPSNLLPAEIEGIVGPISIAAGELDNSFNATHRHAAEGILQEKNATYQTTLYSGAPHGFAVRVNYDIPRHKYAKESSFVQALTWFDAWL